MKRLKQTIFILLLILFGCKNSTSKKSTESLKIIENKPTVSFTFDDGITSDIADFQFEEWNEMILSHLDKENLKAIFFVTGQNKLDEKGQYLLKTWNNKGHHLANHTFNHPNFDSEKNTSNIFKNELIRTDSIISKFSNSSKFFRFPYLKEGGNPLKVDSIRDILSENNYLNGYVTIGTSDWYVNHRLIKKIQEVGLAKTPINKFKDFYVEHIFERANYYENISYEINERHINHTILLHHNLTSALFLDDLIKKFKEEGWDIIDADKAYQDEIFDSIPNSKFAGESLIYSIAKQSEKFDNSLRYPSEDSRYEKDKMDKLGL